MHRKPRDDWIMRGSFRTPELAMQLGAGFSVGNVAFDANGARCARHLCSPRFAPMLIQHPFGGDMGQPLFAGGDQNRRLPVGWDSSGSRPLVDSLDIRADAFGQHLAGWPGVDQRLDWVFVFHGSDHNGRFFHLSTVETSSIGENAAGVIMLRWKAPPPSTHGSQPCLRRA